jgi:hypothetical protein
MHRKLPPFIVRACGIAVLAPLVSAAWAGPGADVPDRGFAARDSARALFRPENAIAAQAGPQDGALAGQRGGTDTRNDARTDGAVAANTAVNVVTGANSIDAGSFANMAGIPVVIQNSGANVLIQNATIINLQFK